MRQADVMVYAATAAGVSAAVAAASSGSRVIVVEPGRHVGGMASGGLGYTDIGDPRVVGGAALRLQRDIADHYGVTQGRFAGPEPHVAERIFERWLVEARVEVVFGCRLESVSVDGGRIGTARLSSGEVVSARVFIDASYEGDLLAMAGVPYSVGREDRALHGERFAGRQELLPGMHTMPPWISPFAGDGDGFVDGALLPQIRPGELADVGRGDGGVMAYGYRVCLSQASDRIPFERPHDYDDDYWELGRRLFAEWKRRRVDVSVRRLIGLEPNLPNGKSDGNSLGPFSLNVLDGAAWQYPDASPARREELRAHHLRHTSGFLHFLATDRSVPRAARREIGTWGLAADEFADTAHLPHQLYVREARRMRGELVLTEHDLLAGRRFHDTIACGSYHIDVREVQRVWRWVYEHPRPTGMVFTEGYLSVPVPPYGIPYRSIIPSPADCTNLLVPVCVSASHVAFSSVRMEPQFQMLGHAAGIAAASIVEGDVDAHAVDTAALRQALRSSGQVVDLP